MTTNCYLILLINFLYSTCNGLLLPIIPPHIMENGGNFIAVGTYVTATTAAQFISRDFVTLFEHEMKFTILFSLTNSFILHMILTFAPYSFTIILLCRLFSALTDQVENSCKEFALKIASEDQHTATVNIINIGKTAGFALGAVIGGFIYESYYNLSYNTCLACLLMVSSILMLQNIHEDYFIERPQLDMTALEDKCKAKLNNLSKIDYHEYKSPVILKVSYIITFTVYLTTYGMILNYNYGIGITETGYTIAYQTMIMFACDYAVSYFKRQALNQFSKENFFNNTLLLCLITLVGAYYAPTYECYLMIFIPMILGYTIINSFLEDDVLNLKSQENIYDALDTLTNLTNIFVPLATAIICEFLGIGIAKMLSLLPMLFCIYMAHQRIVIKVKED